MKSAPSKAGQNPSWTFWSAWSVFSVLLLAAFLWAPHAAKVAGYNTFIAADSLFALGLAMAISLISVLLLPSGALDLLSPFFSFVAKKASVLSLLILIALTIGLLWINKNVLLSFMNSADEHSCYFLAECLRRGKFFTAPHALGDFFNVVHVGNRAGKWFSVYPPGWPLLFAMGLQFQIQDALNPVLTAMALGLFFLSGKKLFGAGPAFLGILIAAISPFFLFTGASYFSHGTCLLMVSLFFYAYLRWQEAESEQGKVFWATVCGLATGYGLFTRYLTMFVIAAPFALERLWSIYKRKTKWTKAETFFTGAVLLFVVLTLVQNFTVTGKPFKAPNRFDKSWERLGFHGDYTPVTALAYFIARIFYLADWAPPAFILLYFLGLFERRRFSFAQNMFRAGFLWIAFGYALYFSWGGNQYGPRYYYEGFPFLSIAAADFVCSSWKSGAPALRKLIFILLLSSLGTAPYQFSKQAALFHKITEQRKALYDLADSTAQKPALVFIHGFIGKELVMSEDDAVRNSPWLDGPVLYAHDRGEENSKLMAAFPSRSAYRGTVDPQTGKASLERLGPA